MENINTITTLPTNERRIIKQINIITEYKKNNEFNIGYILYEREFSQTYKCQETPMKNRDFSFYLEYPRQDTFPNDILDGIILQSVRNSYPKATLKNYSLILNTDKVLINKLQNREIVGSRITVSPDLSQMDIYKMLDNSSFPGLNKQIILHSNLNKGLFPFVSFNANYNLEDRDILEKINNIVFI